MDVSTAASIRLNLMSIFSKYHYVLNSGTHHHMKSLTIIWGLIQDLRYHLNKRCMVHALPFAISYPNSRAFAAVNQDEKAMTKRDRYRSHSPMPDLSPVAKGGLGYAQA